MKKLGVFIFLLLVLTGCGHAPFESYAEIEWVDFIKWDGQEYDGIQNGELADRKLIGNRIGEVKFNVSENIHTTGYKIKDGDSAFHEKGTKIYEIKGEPNLIAVKSSRSINGYDVYYSREDGKYRWHFKDMPIDKVNKIEIFLSDSSNSYKPITNIYEPEKVRQFLGILKNSKENPDFQPKTENGDPSYYQMVLYTGDPIAYKYDIQFDGHTYYWHPWESSILSNEIQDFINQP